MTYPTVQVWADVSGNPLSSAPTWTDISAYVCHDTLEATYGRSRGVDEFQPGSGSFSLINIDGRFDPTNTAGAYHPNFNLRTRVRITVDLGSGPGQGIPTGYIASITQRWNHRAEQVAVVSWVDILGVLATVELPESAWDHVIANRAGKYVWHKLGTDDTNVVRDHSGNSRHGQYIVYERGIGPYEASACPVPIILAGKTDPLSAEIPRPSQSWGKMIAEADQPFGGVALNENWRSVAIKCHQDTAGLVDGDWSFETWVIPKISYALGSSNQRTVTPTPLGLFQWGDSLKWPTGVASPVASPMLRFGWRETLPGEYVVSTFTSAGALAYATSGGSALFDGEAQHLVVTRVGTSIEIYKNGELDGSASMADPMPAGFPMLLCPSNGWGVTVDVRNMAGWWGTVGDVVVYDRALTTAEIDESYAAGMWGRVDSFTGPMGVGQAMEQIETVIAADVTLSLLVSSAGGSPVHPVTPGPFARRTALEALRELATAEGGPLYAESDDLLYLGNVWQLSWSGDDPEWVLTDDDIVTGDDNEIGHNGVDGLTTDLALVVNDATVTWVGGDARAENATSVARFGRLRKSIATPLSLVSHAQDRADWEVWRRGEPQPDIASVSVDLTSDREFAFGAGAYWGQTVRVIATRPDGSQLDAPYTVEQISHRIEMGQGAWRVTLGLFPFMRPARPFVIDISTLAPSGTDVLWF